MTEFRLKRRKKTIRSQFLATFFGDRLVTEYSVALFAPFFFVTKWSQIGCDILDLNVTTDGRNLFFVTESSVTNLC